MKKTTTKQEKTTDEKIFERLEDLRVNKWKSKDGLKNTQENYAVEVFEVSRSTYINWQKKATLTAGQILKACNVLECSPNYLLCQTDSPNEECEAIAKKTGLSDEAITQLLDDKNNFPVLFFVLNTLIERLRIFIPEISDLEKAILYDKQGFGSEQERERNIKRSEYALSFVIGEAISQILYEYEYNDKNK